MKTLLTAVLAAGLALGLGACQNQTQETAVDSPIETVTFAVEGMT